MNPGDVRPGMVLRDRHGEPILVRDFPDLLRGRGWVHHFPGWELRTGNATYVSVRAGNWADVVELPSRVVTFVAIREGLVQLWDDAAGEMIELPEDRLGVGERCLEPGRPFVVRLDNGRPVWVVGPADAG